jgi:hypothetical protein
MEPRGGILFLHAGWKRVGGCHAPVAPGILLEVNDVAVVGLIPGNAHRRRPAQAQRAGIGEERHGSAAGPDGRIVGGAAMPQSEGTRGWTG